MTKKLFDENYEKFIISTNYVEMSISLMDGQSITCDRHNVISKDDYADITTRTASGKLLDVIVPYESIVAIYLEKRY